MNTALFDNVAAGVWAVDGLPGYTGTGVAIGTAIILSTLVALAIWVLIASRIERGGAHQPTTARQHRPVHHHR
ncbi:hypothetical protein ACWELJ_09125 [Nocardia sp. NPDC004582]